VKINYAERVNSDVYGCTVGRSNRAGVKHVKNYRTMRARAVITVANLTTLTVTNGRPLPRRKTVWPLVYSHGENNVASEQYVNSEKGGVLRRTNGRENTPSRHLLIITIVLMFYFDWN